MGLIWGHRGAAAEYPENTMAGFRHAIDLGIEGIELDVHLSKDGVPVVIHDESVDRTTNGTGDVAELTVDELRKLDAGQGEYVPTLAEVLDMVGNKLIVDIEVKANAAGEAVLEEVKGRDLRWLISSFDWDVLRYVRSVDKDAEIWVLALGATDDAIETFKELDASTLAIWQRAVDEDIARMLNEKKIPFWPWTVNDPEQAKQFVRWGAVGICTDDPTKLKEALEG